MFAYLYLNRNLLRSFEPWSQHKLQRTERKTTSAFQLLMATMSFSFADFLSVGQILLLCFLACVFLAGKAMWQNAFSKLPPGPWGMPVIGKVTYFCAIFRNAVLCLCTDLRDRLSRHWAFAMTAMISVKYNFAIFAPFT